MPKRQEVFAKLEPSFILGWSTSGSSFSQLSDRDQLRYLRLWAYAVQMHTDCFCIAGQEAAFIGRYLRIRTDIVPGFFERLCSANLLARVEEGFYRLLGVKKKHKGLQWRPDPFEEQTAPEQEQNQPGGTEGPSPPIAPPARPVYQIWCEARTARGLPVVLDNKTRLGILKLESLVSAGKLELEALRPAMIRFLDSEQGQACSWSLGTFADRVFQWMRTESATKSAGLVHARGTS